jgi:hypothetical protein
MKEAMLSNGFVSVLLLVAAVIHLLPLAGLFSAENLQRLYGVTAADTDMLILLRHRAVLFGLLGALILLSLFFSQWRGLAIGAGLVSAVSFVLIAKMSAGYGEAIARVVVADWVAIGCLVVAAIACWLRPSLLNI